MRRRTFIISATAAVVWPNAVRAQQKTWVIGILGYGEPGDPAIKRNLLGLRQGLKQSGFVEGENLKIEYRWADGDAMRLPELAAELIARSVDVIVTEGGVTSALAAKAATTTTPIVFHTPDAIRNGIVSNLARPGGNLTGVSLFAPELLSKQLEILTELTPKATAIGLLVIPKNQIDYSEVAAIEAMAHRKGLAFQFFDADTARDAEAAYSILSGVHVGGIVVRANSIFAEPLIELAVRARIPTVYNQRAYPDRGGLLSYGVSLPAVYVTKGEYTAKILRGAKPGNLPVIQPTAFELVINLRTAKALDLSIPQLLLARADEVIE